MKTFMEYIKQHTLLNHYRVEDPRLMSQISIMDGTEVDEDDDGQGGIVTIDAITHQETAAQLKQMAAAGQIKIVAGEVTRDMTGKARPMGVQYYQTQEAALWGDDEGAIKVLMNLYEPKFGPLVEKLIKDEFHERGMEPEVRRVFWLAMGRIFMNLAKSYGAQ